MDETLIAHDAPIRIPTLPEDSYVKHWITQFENTEIYPSWRQAVGLAVIGAVLRRDVYFPMGMVEKIYPNTSVLLLGESGDGKNTIIEPAEKIMKAAGVAHIQGKTMEAVKHSLVQLSSVEEKIPAVGYITAKELAEFLGTKDYQSGIMETITELLSNGETFDCTLRKDMDKDGKGGRMIYAPTVTMFAGSTPDWLRKLPKGSLDGGFLPRFIVAAETSKQEARIAPVSHPGHYVNHAQKSRVEGAAAEFLANIAETRKRFGGRTTVFVETNGFDNAEGFYTNWYANRFRHFTPLTKAYANRSGGLVQKLAMLTAVSCHRNYISEADYHFATEFVVNVTKKLEDNVLLPSSEIYISRLIFRHLPAKYEDVLFLMAKKFPAGQVREAIRFLSETKRIKIERGVLFPQGDLSESTAASS